MLTKTSYQHIMLNDDGIPMIAGTMTKVVEIVLDSKAYGWSPEEIHFQHPQLALGQIYSALAYYWDHQDEIDSDIERRLQAIDRLKESFPPTPLETRLRRDGLI